VQECQSYNLFHVFVCVPGGHDVILTLPKCRRLRSIVGEGNCLFCALSYIISGSEDQHSKIRALIISHMLSIPHMLIGIGPKDVQTMLLLCLVTAL